MFLFVLVPHPQNAKSSSNKRKEKAQNAQKGTETKPKLTRTYKTNKKHNQIFWQH